jgi:hypothetical protein
MVAMPRKEKKPATSVTVVTAPFDNPPTSPQTNRTAIYPLNRGRGKPDVIVRFRSFGHRGLSIFVIKNEDDIMLTINR